jgi:formate-dependent nitrite reductase membrane component NrfD
MKKITDRQTLGFYSGLMGGLVMLIFDWVSYSFGLSKRMYTETAAGVWVNNKGQTKTLSGHILGAIMTLTLCMLGGVAKVNLLSKSGRDKLFTKGLWFGVSFGAIITALTSGFVMNKVKPKDANSNLSYVAASGLYGLVTTYAIAKLGDDSLFDQEPMNDQIRPTTLTGEEQANAPLAAK